MDFHDVAAEGCKANVLGTIDLDPLQVKLAIMNHRTTQNRKMFMYDRILFSEGTPVSIHSNYAWESIGRVMTHLVHICS